MSFKEKSIVSNLEDKSDNSIDYGNSELNKIFKDLDEETQKQILEYPKKEIQIEILRDLANTELTILWNSLSEKQQKRINSVGIHDKYLFLKGLLEKKKEKKISQDVPEFISHIPRTPDYTPPDIKSPGTPDFPPPKSPDFPPPKSPDFPPPESVIKDAPIEIFPMEELQEDKRNNEKKYEKKQPQQRFDDLVKLYYSINPYSYSSSINHELEVKFGTKGIRTLTRNDYDNVIKKLKSSGFNLIGDTNGQYYLRVNCEFLDSTTGRFKLSDVRTEIRGLHSIQEYCKNNDIKGLISSNPVSVDFIHKKPGFINREKIYPVDFDDFNFRVSYQTEEKVKKGIQNFVIENWRKSKKEFRFINRVSFEHPDHPFIVDISITKFGNRGPDRYGRENRGQMIRVYTVEESNVFNNQEVYEIEIEINNKNIGPTTQFNTPNAIVTSLRKVIKYVLCGLQGTNYPVSYPEQNQVIESYMKLIWKDDYDNKKQVRSKNFIGPNSITLQLKNIAPIDENSNDPNIRRDFVVTDKADGERHLMVISEHGKIYLINTNMDVIFTGAKTDNKECFNCIIDGELISHDKNGRFINLYAAFDVYYVKKNRCERIYFYAIRRRKRCI